MTGDKERYLKVIFVLTCGVKWLRLLDVVRCSPLSVGELVPGGLGVSVLRCDSDDVASGAVSLHLDRFTTRAAAVAARRHRIGVHRGTQTFHDTHRYPEIVFNCFAIVVLEVTAT